MADATITFDTSIDPNGFEDGVGDMDKKTNGLKGSLASVSEAISAAFDPKNVDDTSSAIMKQQSIVDELKAKLNAIAEIEAMSPIAEQLQEELSGATKEVERFDAEIEQMQQAITETQRKIQLSEGAIGSFNNIAAAMSDAVQDADINTSQFQTSISSVREAIISNDIDAYNTAISELRQSVEGANIDFSQFEESVGFMNRAFAARGALDEGKASLADMREELDVTINSSAAAGEKIEDLKQKLSNINMPEQPKESAEKLSQKLSVANQKLDEMKHKANQSAQSATTGMEGLSSAIERTASRIKNLVVGAFVFNVLRSAIKQFRDYVFLAAKENEAFAKSFNQFKANVTAAIQPLLNLLIPALTKVAQVFSYISGYILQVVSLIANSSVTQLYSQAKSRDKGTREAEAAHAKEMAAYQDRLAKAKAQRAREEEQEAARIAKEMERREKAQAANAEKHSKAVAKQADKQQKYLDKLKKSNKELEKSTASFDDLIMLSSNSSDEEQEVMTFDEIPFEELEFDELSSNLKDAIIEGFDAGMDQGIYDNITEPTELTDAIKQVIGIIMAILGGALLVLGAILVFTGVNIPLGLALMVAGALLLYTALSEDLGLLPKKLQDTIAIIAAIVGGALLVIGCILVFTGANIPIGLALLVAGAVMMATALAAKWNDLPENIQKVISIVMAALGGALLVLGCILVFAGVAAPLGMGLIVAGAALLATTAALNWNNIPPEIQNVISAVMIVLGTAFLVLGCLLAFTGVNLPLGVALIVAGAASLVGVIALNWDKLGDDIGGMVAAILAIVSPALLVLGCVLAFTGAALPLGIALIAAGAAGMVAAIALSDRMTPEVKDTISKILAIVGGAMLALGIILCVFGALPIGIALIIAGVGSLIGAFAINKDEILDTITGVLDKVKEAFDNAWAWIKYGASMAWWGIQTGVLSAVNFVINVINKMIDGILWPFNKIIEGLNQVPGVDIGYLSWSIPNIQLPAKPEMPALAKGAVLPGGAPFAAIVNDQPAGQTNIEAPLATIEEAVSNVLEGQLYDILDAASAPVVAKITGNCAWLFRNINIELEREKKRSSAF